MLRQTFVYLVNCAFLYSLLLVTYFSQSKLVTFSQSEWSVFAIIITHTAVSVVIDSATYLLTISLPDIDNITEPLQHC